MQCSISQMSWRAFGYYDVFLHDLISFDWRAGNDKGWKAFNNTD